jgi:hypothetical protein
LVGLDGRKGDAEDFQAIHQLVNLFEQNESFAEASTLEILDAVLHAVECWTHISHIP